MGGDSAGLAQFDPYAILGIELGADAKDIKRAYRSLSLQYHPDKNPGNKMAEDMFMKIAKAYEALTDATVRVLTIAFTLTNGHVDIWICHRCMHVLPYSCVQYCYHCHGGAAAIVLRCSYATLHDVAVMHSAYCIPGCHVSVVAAAGCAYQLCQRQAYCSHKLMLLCFAVCCMLLMLITV
jgi:DnaJ domain